MLGQGSSVMDGWMALGDWHWPVQAPKSGFTVSGCNELATVFWLELTEKGFSEDCTLAHVKRVG